MTQWIVIQTLVLAPLSRGWLKIGQSTFIRYINPVSIWDTPHPSWDHRVAEQSPLSSKRDTSKASNWSPHHRVHGRSDMRPSFHSWQLSYHKQAHRVPSQHTNSQEPKRQGLCWSICEKYTRNIPASFSVKFLCFGGLAWNVSSWHVYLEAWDYNFPLLNVFFTCDIDGLAIGWIQSILESWFGIWIEVLQTGIRHVSFFTCM